MELQETAGHGQARTSLHWASCPDDPTTTLIHYRTTQPFRCSIRSNDPEPGNNVVGIKKVRSIYDPRRIHRGTFGSVQANTVLLAEGIRRTRTERRTGGCDQGGRRCLEKHADCAASPDRSKAFTNEPSARTGCSHTAKPVARKTTTANDDQSVYHPDHGHVPWVRHWVLRGTCPDGIISTRECGLGKQNITTVML